MAFKTNENPKHFGLADLLTRILFHEIKEKGFAQ